VTTGIAKLQQLQTAVAPRRSGFPLVTDVPQWDMEVPDMEVCPMHKTSAVIRWRWKLPRLNDEGPVVCDIGDIRCDHLVWLLPPFDIIHCLLAVHNRHAALLPLELYEDKALWPRFVVLLYRVSLLLTYSSHSASHTVERRMTSHVVVSRDAVYDVTSHVLRRHVSYSVNDVGMQRGLT